MDNAYWAARPPIEYAPSISLQEAAQLLEIGYIPTLRNRLTITVAEFRAISGLGKTLTFSLLASEKLLSTLVGGRRLIYVPSAVRLLAPSLLQGGE